MPNYNVKVQFEQETFSFLYSDDKDNMNTGQNLENKSEDTSKEVREDSNNPEDSAASIWAFIVFQHWWKKWYN